MLRGLRGDVAARELRVRADGGVLLGERGAQIAARQPPARCTPTRRRRCDRRVQRQARGERLRRRAHRVQRAERIAETGLRARPPGDERAGGCDSSGSRGRTRCRC